MSIDNKSDLRKKRKKGGNSLPAGGTTDGNHYPT